MEQQILRAARMDEARRQEERLRLPRERQLQGQQAQDDEHWSHQLAWREDARRIRLAQEQHTYGERVLAKAEEYLRRSAQMQQRSLFHEPLARNLQQENADAEQPHELRPIFHQVAQAGHVAVAAVDRTMELFLGLWAYAENRVVNGDTARRIRQRTEEQARVVQNSMDAAGISPEFGQRWVSIVNEELSRNERAVDAVIERRRQEREREMVVQQARINQETLARQSERAAQEEELARISLQRIGSQLTQARDDITALPGHTLHRQQTQALDLVLRLRQYVEDSTVDEDSAGQLKTRIAEQLRVVKEAMGEAALGFRSWADKVGEAAHAASKEVHAAIERRRRLEERERQRERLRLQAWMGAEGTELRQALGSPFTENGLASEPTAFSFQNFLVDQQRRVNQSHRSGADVTLLSENPIGSSVTRVEDAFARTLGMSNSLVTRTPMEQRQQVADQQAELQWLGGPIISTQMYHFLNPQLEREYANARLSRQRLSNVEAVAQMLPQKEQRRKAVSKLCVARKIEMECSICKDPDNHGDDGVLKLPCSHEFGAACITTWLEKNNTCPLCRKDYKRQLGSLDPWRLGADDRDAATWAGSYATIHPSQMAYMRPRPSPLNRPVIAPATWSIHPEYADSEDDELVTSPRTPPLLASRTTHHTWSTRRRQAAIVSAVPTPLSGPTPDTDNQSDYHEWFPYFA